MNLEELVSLANKGFAHPGVVAERGYFIRKTDSGKIQCCALGAVRHNDCFEVNDNSEDINTVMEWINLTYGIQTQYLLAFIMALTKTSIPLQRRICYGIKRV